MLDSINLNDKSFEQIRDEAVAQIPIYSRDWTNYNAADPGITILENLAAFLALQQSEINEVPEKIKEKLLGLAGFTIRKGNAAAIYVSLKRAAAQLPYVMPTGAKLYAQDICFEPAARTCVRDIGILAVKADAAGGERLHMLLEPQGVRGGLAVLGEEPRGGESVSFYVKNLPDAGVKAAIYFELAQRFHRNPMEAGTQTPFAQVKWELYTVNGYAGLEVCDGTCGFLQSGYVSFGLKQRLRGRAAKDEARDAYVIRLTLERADYDIVPRFEKISGLLTQLIQKDTRSEVVRMRLSGHREICVNHYLLKDGFLEVYGKREETCEKDESAGYSIYQEGMQYRTEYVDSYTRRIIFGQEAPQEILAVCRDESVMVHRKLGMLYGYDEQVIPLPDNPRVYPQAFSVLVVDKARTGDAICHPVKPGSESPGEVCYSVNEKDNTLIIHDCGIYEGAWLWLGDYAVYGGEGGNILANAELLYGQEGAGNLLEFVCCTGASDGRFEEDCLQLQRRFSRDVRTPMTMVTQKDCECIVRNIPGLSIHKIGVYAVPDKNEIHIAIKPNSGDPRPMLSPIYMDEIYRYLENYRMLTTRLIIEQPVYVPVNVTGVIYVKKHFERCRERIEEMLGKLLDGIHSDTPFGSRIVFYEIYRRLSEMDAVDRIHELSIFPDSSRDAVMSGMDIMPAFNALCYPGTFRLELTEAGANGFSGAYTDER